MDSVKRIFQKASGFILGCKTEAAEPARTPDRSWEATDGSQLVHHQVRPGQGAISRADKSKTRSRRSVPFRDWPHASAVPHHWQHGAAPSSGGIVADTFSGRAEEEKKNIKSPAGVCDRAAAAEERLAAAERKIHDLDHYAQARDSEVARLSDQLQGAELNRQTQQQHLRHLEHTLRSTETALRDLEDRHRRETKIRQMETEVARRFLQRSDSLSETDVKDQVMKLNEEVFQIAANIVDNILDGGGDETGVCVSVGGSDAQTVELLIGGPAVRALDGSRIGEGAFDIALQSAVMICLIRHLASVVQSWVIPSSSGDVITPWETAYRRLLHEEGANVARQWRAMTKRSLRTAERERPGLCAHLAGFLCRDLATVMEFAQERCFGGRQQGTIDFEPYRERLAHVAMLAIELNESVGFGVSSKLLVFTAQTGQVFDRRSMLDFWSDPVEATESARDQQKEEIVVGSCALGLKRESDSESVNVNAASRPHA